MNAGTIFTLVGVEKRYTAGGTAFRLSIPRLEIARGAKLAFVGESGAGKSTLLDLLAMLLRPSECGTLQFCPQADRPAHDIDAAWAAGDADLLSDLRSRHIGYVLQSGGLLPYLTVRDNIDLSRRLQGRPLGDAAQKWAKKLDIAPQLDKMPAELSVGQRQRAAIARALAHEPPVVIADEPTASIDPRNAERIMILLTQLADELGVTLIVATHAQALAERLGLTLVRHQIEAANDHAMHVTVAAA